MAGTVGRTDYDYAYGRGAYLTLKDKSGIYTCYDSSFNQSPIHPEYGSSEYDYDYKTKTITHPASNQQAFCPGCALTSDDVEVDWYLLDNTVYDLQGNVLFTTDVDSLGSTNDRQYLRARKDGKYGIVRRDDGAVVLPIVYDSIDYSYSGAEFVCVTKDGKVGFASVVTGEDAYISPYSDSVATVYGMTGRVKDLTGEYLIITPYGQLEQRFTDVSLCYGGNAEIFLGEVDGETAVYDLHGVKLTDGGSYGSVDQAGTAALIYLGSRQYILYTLVNGIVSTDDEAPTNIRKDDAPADDEAASANATWICPACGTTNSGKFCPEDGTARPAAESADWICTECGTSNSGKFCTECGAARP